MRFTMHATLPLAFVALCGMLGMTPAFAQKKAATTLKVGDKAPAFESLDDQGKAWKSADVIGKKTVVLYFYPADLTGGCTKQACGYRDELSKLTDSGVEVIGVSGDSPENHRLFKKVHKLNFTLLADEKGDVAKKFGIPVTEGKKTFEFKGSDGTVATLVRGSTISRYTVVIGRNGNIAAIDAVGDTGGDSKRIQDIVKGLDAK